MMKRLLVISLCFYSLISQADPNLNTKLKVDSQKDLKKLLVDEAAIKSQTGEVVSDRYAGKVYKFVNQINQGDYDQVLSNLKQEAVQNKKQQKYKWELTAPKIDSLPADRRYYLKGMALRRKGLYQEAFKALKHSVELRGSDGDVIAELAYTLLALGKEDKAKQYFQESLWFGGLKEHVVADIYYQIGMLEEQENHENLAESNYKQALSVDPNYIQAALKLAEMKFRAGDKKQAIKLLRDAYFKNPQDKDLASFYAKVLLTNVDPVLEAENIKTAFEVISAVMQIENDRFKSTAFSTYIKALLLSDKLELASQEVQLAKKAYPNSQEINRLVQQIKIEKKIKKQELKKIETKNQI